MVFLPATTAQQTIMWVLNKPKSVEWSFEITRMSDSKLWRDQPVGSPTLNNITFPTVYLLNCKKLPMNKITIMSDSAADDWATPSEFIISPTSLSVQ